MSSENTQVALANFSMKDLQDRIAESVQATFGMMMPKDAFNALTEKAINDYFHKSQSFEVKEIIHPEDTRKYSYDQRKILAHGIEMTAFELQVFRALTPIVDEAIHNWLTTNENAVKAAADAALLEEDVSEPFNKSILKLAAKVAQHQAVELIQAVSLKQTMQLRDSLNQAGIRTSF